MSGAGKTVRTVPATGDPGIDGLLTGYAWGGNTITYGWPQTNGEYGVYYNYIGSEKAGFRPLTPAMQVAADFALGNAFGPAAASTSTTPRSTASTSPWCRKGAR